MKYYNLKDLKVLIVDDNRFMLRVLHHCLESMNVGEIVMARSGTDALGKLRDRQIDLIITDIEMDHGDGLELIKTIRKDQRLADPLLPVIVLSANTIRKVILQARDAGMTEFLAKPISAKALYRRIVSIIESPRNFVRTRTYFGPDRRRRQDPLYMGDKRRRTD